MEELRPVREFLAIELWQYEDGEIGWRMKSNCHNEPKKDIAEHLLMELAESFVGDVRLSIFMQDKGTITTRWLPGTNFGAFKTFLWLKMQLHQVQWNTVKRNPNPQWRTYWWSLCWLAHKIAGHFKPSQNTAAAGATPVPATPAEASLDLSTALLGQSQPRSATVLPFPSRKP